MISKSEFNVDIISALEQGNKIGAIKILREQKNLGLKEAKEAVEAFLDDNPEIKQKMNSHQASGGTVIGYLVFIAIAYAIYHFFIKAN